MTEKNRTFRPGSLSRRQFSGLAAVGIAAPFLIRGASAQSLKKVTFLLDVQPYSKHALFYPAVAKGFFAKHGLDVTINAGKGSADVAQKIASKAAEFGFVDAGVSIIARGKGMPIKLVNMVHYKNMMSIIGNDTTPMKTPKDLEGRKVAANAGDAVKVAFAAVCALNGADFKKVNFVSVETANKRPLLFAKQVDACCDFAVNLPVYLAGGKEVGMPISQVLFSDFGVDLYSNGIVAHDELLKSDPAVVKAFNDALVESMIWAIANREEAVKILLEQTPKSNPELALQGLNVAIAHLLVPEVAVHGIGPMDEAKMAATSKIIHDYFGMTTAVAMADIYSNDFVTPGKKPA
jgi:NitT/TauT family transport system substrate-binding protein